MILNDGEVICDKCNDIGYIKNLCPKCMGKGKLDWVTNAMGSIKPRFFKVSFSQTSMSETSNSFEIDFQGKLMEEMTREVAKQIDKEILESLSHPDSMKRHYIGRPYDY